VVAVFVPTFIVTPAAALPASSKIFPCRVAVMGAVG